MLHMVLIGALLAGSGSDQAGERCAGIASDAGRLACYDAVYRRPGEPAAPAAAAAPTGTPAAAAPPVPESEFGLSGHQREQQRGATNRIEELRIVVQSVEPSRSGRATYRLSNGQRWVQSEATDRPAFSAGDVIVIRRASMGSFLAVVPDSGRAAIRVKRLE